MAKITYVYGPFRQDSTPRWWFAGQRSDSSLRTWALEFNASTRKWSLAISRRAKDNEAKVATPDALFCVPHHRHERPKGKTVVEILKNCLPPEEVARAVALSIARGK